MWHTGGRLVAALHPDDVVLGGGNVQETETLPPGCRGRQCQRVPRRFSPLGRCKKWPALHPDQRPIKVDTQKEHEPWHQPNAITKRPGIEPLTKRKAWKALETHYK